MSATGPMTTLIVGAGRFAGNYLKVMAEWNRMADTGACSPVFTPLIITRTSLEKARAAAQKVRLAHGDSFGAVLAEEVKDGPQLKTVLDTHRPGLICITARDREQGDRIHAEYSRLALDAGMVLCEKPFSSARGDGRSLVPLKTLLHHPHAGRFGMHLPMAVARRALQQHERLGPMLEGADQLHFIWQKQNTGGDLIDDLAVHPWSLIPDAASVRIEGISPTPQGIRLAFRRKSSAAAGNPAGSMLLQTGGGFRGMLLDGMVLQFDFSAGALHVLELEASWPDLLSGKLCPCGGVEVLEIENPLRQHLRSLLMGRPIVDMQEALSSQRYLESAHLLYSAESEI
ncbi:MAG: hypothetical protein P8X55_15040 [Desulfosarcinaceae bacterium]